MDLADKPLPIDIRKLGALTEKCHAFAKALHYREIEFHSYPADTIEALISINNQLQQPEAAKGILVYARQHDQVGAPTAPTAPAATRANSNTVSYENS